MVIIIFKFSGGQIQLAIFFISVFSIHIHRWELHIKPNLDTDSLTTSECWILAADKGTAISFIVMQQFSILMVKVNFSSPPLPLLW